VVKSDVYFLQVTQVATELSMCLPHKVNLRMFSLCTGGLFTYVSHIIIITRHKCSLNYLATGLDIKRFISTSTLRLLLSQFLCVLLSGYWSSLYGLFPQVPQVITITIPMCSVVWLLVLIFRLVPTSTPGYDYNESYVFCCLVTGLNFPSCSHKYPRLWL
jgi:hypothetical protein